MAETGQIVATTSAPTGLRARKRKNALARIEQTAMDLFETVGFENTTVDDIAEKAEVSRTSLFRYYGSKDDIIFNPEHDAFTALRALISQDPSLALDELMIRFTEHLLDTVPDLRRRLDIIVRTPKLMARLADMEATWELAIAEDLAARRGERSTRTLEDLVFARMALSAYFVPAVEWPRMPPGTALLDLVSRATRLIHSGCSSSLDLDGSAP